MGGLLYRTKQFYAMKKKFLFACWLAICGLGLARLTAQSQNQKVIFPTPAGFEYSNGQTIRPTADGGYILTGWAKTDDNQSWTSLPRVIKVDADLQTQWDGIYLQASPPGPSVDVISAGWEMPDGKFLVSMKDDSTSNDLLRFDAAGTLLDVLALPNNTQDLRIKSALPNGNLVATRHMNIGGWKAGIVHLDGSGAIVYQQTIDAIGNSEFDALPLSNGDLLFRTYNFQVQKYTLYRVDNLGNLIWQSPPTPNLGGRLVATPDGGFALSSESTPAFSLRLFDGQGNLTSTTPVFPIQGTVGSLAFYPDGSLLVAGTTVTNRGFMLRLTLDGTQLWAVESPADNQPDQFRLSGWPTADGWAVGVSDLDYYSWGLQTHFGMLRVQANTGIFINTLSGRVAKDNDESCTVEAAEPGVGHTRITATNAGGETWGTFSDAAGDYTLLLPSGDFTLTSQPVYPFFYQCPAAPAEVSFAPMVNGLAALDLPLESQNIIHQISGHLTLDQNGNCLADAGEAPLQNWYLQLVVGNQHLNLNTDANGYYSLFVPDGNYQLQAYPFNYNFGFCGAAAVDISFNDPTPSTFTADFVAFPKTDCAQMRAYLSSSNIRPCTTATVYAEYRNDGTVVAENAGLHITLDPGMNYASAVPAPSQVDGNELWFNLGDVPPTPSGWQGSKVKIYVQTDCDLPVGNQVCVQSEVTPDEWCPDDWDGAIVAVEGECIGDSAFFTIKNIGNAPNSQSLDFVIVEDQIVLKQGMFQLPPGGFQVEGVLPLGIDTAVTIIADQEPGFPGNTSVTFSLANCISGHSQPGAYGGSPGPFSTQYCRAVTGSYDPNDKDAYPAGSGPEHVVYPGTPLLYTIRFQNTGTDTAFTVVLRDTLSPHLDPATLRIESASHPCEVFLYGDLVEITFHQILLPDSTINPEASQGFVSFSIDPRPDLPPGTVVENRAAIYFDYNEAVLTNTVSRKYDQLFTVKIDDPKDGRLSVKIYPNPFSEMTTLELPESAPAGQYVFELYDFTGRSLKTLSFDQSQLTIRREDLPEGVFGWRLMREGMVMASGTVTAAGE